MRLYRKHGFIVPPLAGVAKELDSQGAVGD